MHGSQAEESLEGGHGLLPAVVPEDELVKVDLELAAAHAVVGAYCAIQISVVECEGYA